VFHLGVRDADGRHAGLRIVVAHDAFVVHLEPELSLHLLGEIDVDCLMAIAGAHVVVTDGGAANSQDVHAVGKVQREREQGAGLHVDLHRGRSLHCHVADGD
jgi:hypothetical protein